MRAVWRGRPYYRHGHYWYRPYHYGDSVHYWAVGAPVGWYYATLPDDHETVVIDNRTYYYSEGTYYTEGEKDGQEGYVVTEAPRRETEPEVEPSGVAGAPDPFETLKAMSNYMGKLKAFRAVASDSFDEVLDTGQVVQLSSHRTIYVSRPDKVSVAFRSENASRRVVYDGKQLTVINRKENLYSTAKMPPTIEQMLDTMVKDYGMSVPLADMLYPNLYDFLVPRIQTGQYVGLHTAGVYQCHHLAFTQDAVDWEIWIQAGGKPLPRKLVITYKLQDGSPRYTATMTSWDISAPPSNVFALGLPEGAQKIEMLPVAPAETEGN